MSTNVAATFFTVKTVFRMPSASDGSLLCQLEQVQFERASSSDEGIVKIIKRNLYHRLNPLPQKKIMTFNKKPNDFYFNVSYGDLSFLSVELKRSLILDNISHVELTGIDAAHEKNLKATSKGVKAYFNLDENGLLHVEKVEDWGGENQVLGFTTNYTEHSE